MATDIDDLQIKIKASASSAYKPIENLVDRLNKLSAAMKDIDANKFNMLATSLDNVSSAIRLLSSSSTSDYTRIAKGLNKFSTLDYSGLNASANGLSVLSYAITNMSKATDGLENVQKLADLANAISRLGYKSIDKAVQNMPLLTDEFSKMITEVSKLPTVNQSIIDYTNALANFASQSKNVSSASKKVDNSLEKNSNSARKAQTSFNGLASAFGKFYATYFLFIRGAKSVWKGIESSMDYVETSNYFSVALGQIGQQFEQAGYESAELYTEALTDELNNLNKKLTGYTLGASGEALFSGDVGLGMDIEQMMNFQAKTLAVTNSVGLMGEASIETAKAVSMLAGDLSSLTNVDVESVMTNLSSGLIGQSRALYKYGIDITQNTLQQYALAEGIEKSVAEMTQAEKMQLRLLAILDQSTVAQTDLASTINSVANQYRVFNQQVDNTGRTLGNLFLPIVQNVLPYVNGLIIALNNLFTSLGFKIYGDTWLEDLQQGISGGAQEGFEDLEGSVDDAADSLNEFKKGVRGFDQLNVLTGGNRVGSGVLEELEGQIDLTDSIASAVADYQKAWDEAFATAENKASEFAEQLTEDFTGVAEMFDRIFPAITGIGTALVTYKIARRISGIVKSLSALASPVGIAALAAGVLVGVATAIKKVHDEAVAADLESRFGNIALSAEDLEEVARKIVDNGNLSGLATTISEIGKLEGIETEIQNSVNSLDRLNWKVSIGMELTEEEQGQYKSAIDSYVENANEYVEQMQYSAIVGIKLFLGDSQTSEEVQAVVNEFYGSQSEKLRNLGEELNKVTTDAWNDGLLSIDEVQTIANIQQQMASIQEKIAASEFQARMQLLMDEYSGAELTPESYAELQEKQQELIDKYTEDYNESLVFSLAQVNLSYQAKLDEASTEEAKEEIKRDWDAAIKELTEGRDLQVSQMALQSLAFDYNTIVDTYGEELDKVIPRIVSLLDEAAADISFLSSTATNESALNGYLNELEKDINKVLKELPKETRDNLKEFLAEFESAEDFEKLAQSYYENTGKVPQSIIDALSSLYILKAISGSKEDLLNALLVDANGVEARQITTAMSTLGIDTVDAYADGIKLNKTIGEQAVTDWLNEISDILQHSDLVSSAEDLGEEISNSFTKGIYSGGSFNGLELGRNLLTPNLSLKAYAGGGMVTSGEVFVARENGMPELVGNFGGRVGVANNDQIIQGIRQAAYEGFLAALSQSGGSGGVTVVLEGDAAGVFRLVRQEENRNYNRTGNSVFVH